MHPHIAIILFILCLFALSCQSDPSNNSSGNHSADVKQKADKNSGTISGVHKQNTSPAYGIDVSKFQGNEIDFLNQQKSDLTFVICKATEGITYTDPTFANNWKMIAQKGFIRGAYHFYRSKDNPILQAKNFMHAIAELKATDIPPIVDIEGAGIDNDQSIEKVQQSLSAFLEEIENELQRKPVIYTNIPIGNKYLDNEVFSEYALWIALYENLEQPKLPKVWENTGWKFWQKSSTYELKQEKNDFDVFHGDREELVNFIQTY